MPQQKKSKLAAFSGPYSHKVRLRRLAVIGLEARLDMMSAGHSLHDSSNASSWDKSWPMTSMEFWGKYLHLSKTRVRKLPVEIWKAEDLPPLLHVEPTFNLAADTLAILCTSPLIPGESSGPCHDGQMLGCTMQQSELRSTSSSHEWTRVTKLPASREDKALFIEKHQGGKNLLSCVISKIVEAGELYSLNHSRRKLSFSDSGRQAIRLGSAFQTLLR